MEGAPCEEEGETEVCVLCHKGGGDLCLIAMTQLSPVYEGRQLYFNTCGHCMHLECSEQWVKLHPNNWRCPACNRLSNMAILASTPVPEPAARAVSLKEAAEWYRWCQEHRRLPKAPALCHEQSEALVDLFRKIKQLPAQPLQRNLQSDEVLGIAEACACSTRVCELLWRKHSEAPSESQKKLLHSVCAAGASLGTGLSHGPTRWLNQLFKQRATRNGQLLGCNLLELLETDAVLSLLFVARMSLMQNQECEFSMKAVCQLIYAAKLAEVLVSEAVVEVDQNAVPGTAAEHLEQEVEEAGGLNALYASVMAVLHKAGMNRVNRKISEHGWITQLSPVSPVPLSPAKLQHVRSKMAPYVRGAAMALCMCPEHMEELPPPPVDASPAAEEAYTKHCHEYLGCLLYTSDAADEEDRGEVGE
eukprot:TRINITY_DN46309_c0_g1_i2.p1 TRINITY_DN46309_c0_g1~~TRINITY_DN46309_c0_g1_i2.p1  ORF type:complete len:418 (+),score=113.60 TRINITY_DN46309_c0_g1_i2:293-1546(+)